MKVERFGKITLINGDCMEFMQSKNDKSFDLAIVDPPYGIDAGSNKRAGTQTGKSLAKKKIYRSGNWDKDIPPKEYIMSKQKKDLLNTKEIYHYLSYENRLHYWN